MRKLIKQLGIVLAFSFSIFVSADDTDIIGSPTDANILFVMDLSGSMAWGKEDNSSPTAADPSRLSALQGAFQAIVDSSEFDSMNFGLSVFSGDGKDDGRGKSVAHGIAYPVSSLIGDAQSILNKTGANVYTHPGTSPNDSYMPDVASNNTSRQYLGLLSEDATDIWNPDGKTPIVDALYEAARYFRGEEAYWGKFPPKDIRAAHPATYVGTPFTENITTGAPNCGVLKSCLKGNCGITERECAIYDTTEWSDTDTGGCTLNDTKRKNCSAATLNSPAKVCASETNCTLIDDTKNSSCYDMSIDECKASGISKGRTYYGCTSEDKTRIITNSEGQNITENYTKVSCEYNITYYQCDDDDQGYSCPIQEEWCSKCEDGEETVTITGGGTYKSPIINACSSNGIILLTDGEPTVNTSAGFITDMISADACDDVSKTGIDLYGRCGPELAKYLSTVDQVDGIIATPEIDGIQTVKVHAIGLGLDAGNPARAYLQELVSEENGSGGTFLEAATQEELTEAFTKLINEIAGRARSFAAPSYSIDTTTLLSHGSSVYVPMFDKQGVVWPGNLKKFDLVDGELKDAAGASATDDDGLILSTAKDLWSDVAVDSTDAVTSGGAANKINPVNRRTTTMKTNVGGALKTFSFAANDDFGAGTTDDEKTDLIKFISGTNPSDDTARNHMGDIMHSKPIQLQYAAVAANATDAAKDAKKIIFVGTNEGFLHAINDSDGTEAFAFMPNELLKNIKPQYNNTVQTEHMYGVDSPITLWIDESGSTHDQVGNGIVDTDEEAYLFFGLRRGGGSYYALNVTNPDVPSLVWDESFGTGDSWSQPVVAQLKWGTHSETNPVLVFGGGHKDDNNAAGNAVYVVNALDINSHEDGGEVIWSTKDAEADTNLAPDSIDNGVPSKIRVLDVNGNGSIDRLYFGDTGGNIWRADLDAGKYDTPTDGYNIDKATLHKFANLGGTAPKRRFFEEPSVAIYKYKGKTIASIAIGSGDRPNPLDASISDKFFVLYDKEVMSEVTQTTINFANLSDIVTTPLAATHNVLDSTFKGWYRSLTSSSGEKVLSTAVTFQNKVLFTTLGVSTGTVTADSCQSTTEARLYVLDLNTGEVYSNEKAASGEILGTPQLIFPEITDVNCTKGNCDRPPVLVCPGFCGPGRLPVELDGIGGSPATTSKVLERIYWIDNEQ